MRCQAARVSTGSFARFRALVLSGTFLFPLFAGRPLLAQTATPLQILEGTLDVVWGDPSPTLGTASDIRYALTLPDGSVRQLHLTGQQSEAAFSFGQRVTIAGRAAEARAALPNAAVNRAAAQTIVVESLAPGAPLRAAAASPASTAAVSGTRRVIFLLLQFSDDGAVPHPPAFYTNMTNPDVPPAGEDFPTTINGFFRKTSDNAFSWSADVGGVGGIGASGGWLTLPHPKSYYAPCGWSSSCALLNTLAEDGMVLGRAQGIDFRTYDNINFVLSNDLDCCAWGGSYYSVTDSKRYGATWEPPWGQETGTYVHEMGHSIGLPHSGWVYYAYDSPWDLMSSLDVASNATCGSYSSTNSNRTRTLYCGEPGDGYIGAHKDFLGWTPPANLVVTDTTSTVDVTLEGGALPLGAATKLIKICLATAPCTGSSAHYFTVEARVKGLAATSQYDNAVPGEGIIIHDVLMNRSPVFGPCFFNSQSGWAVPVDANPGDYNSSTCRNTGSYPDIGLYNAQWVTGQLYINGTHGFSVEVLGRSGSTFTVRVAASSGFGITSHPSSQTVSYNTAATLSVTAAGSGLSYQWYRGLSGDQSTPVGTNSSSYTTPALISTARYWVRVSSAGGGSADSTTATVSVAFTDPVLTSGATSIKAVHFTELRARINALRQAHSVSPVSYPYTHTITATTGLVYAVDLTEMRTALAQVYAVVGGSPSYSTNPTVGTTIRAADIADLRTAVTNIE